MLRREKPRNRERMTRDLTQHRAYMSRENSPTPPLSRSKLACCEKQVPIFAMTIITSFKHGMCLDHSRQPTGRKLDLQRPKRVVWFTLRDKRKLLADPMIRAYSGLIIATIRSGEGPGTHSLASKWARDRRISAPLCPWDGQRHQKGIARGLRYKTEETETYHPTGVDTYKVVCMALGTAAPSRFGFPAYGNTRQTSRVLAPGAHAVGRKCDNSSEYAAAHAH